MSTSKLQQLTGNRILQEFGFPDLKENYRPEWMQSAKGERLELDFFIPSLKIAIEVQGRQHFSFTPRFHSTYDCFLKQQDRDSAKVQLCESNGIYLFEISSTEDMELVIENIRKRLPEIAKTQAPKFRTDEYWNDILMQYIKSSMRSTPEGKIRWGQRKGRQKIAKTKLADAKRRLRELVATFGDSEKLSHRNAISDAQKVLDRRIIGFKNSHRFEKADFDLVSRGVMRFMAEHRPPSAFIANHPLISTQAVDKDAYEYKSKFLVE